jgi:hypothetical protein
VSRSGVRKWNRKNLSAGFVRYDHTYGRIVVPAVLIQLANDAQRVVACSRVVREKRTLVVAMVVVGVTNDEIIARQTAVPDESYPLSETPDFDSLQGGPTVPECFVASDTRLLWPSDLTTNREPRDPPTWAGALCGVGIGFLSGLTGTGGGIFLSPLLLFLGWSATKPASGVAAVFILCNSIAGLLGNITIVKSLPADLAIYAAAVLLGAIVGTTFGIRFAVPMILKALGLVLIIAGLKLIGVY